MADAHSDTRPQATETPSVHTLTRRIALTRENTGRVISESPEGHVLLRAGSTVRSHLPVAPLRVTTVSCVNLRAVEMAFGCWMGSGDRTLQSVTS